MKLLLDIFETGLHVGVFCAGVVLPVGLVVILLDRVANRGKSNDRP